MNTENEKLKFGIYIVAAMFAERLYNGDMDAGMADALSETEIDRLAYTKEEFESLPSDTQENIKKMVAFHKTRLHQQAVFMADKVNEYLLKSHKENEKPQSAEGEFNYEKWAADSATSEQNEWGRLVGYKKGYEAAQSRISELEAENKALLERATNSMCESQNSMDLVLQLEAKCKRQEEALREISQSSLAPTYDYEHGFRKMHQIGQIATKALKP